MAKQLNISLKALRNLEQGKGGVTIGLASQILGYFGKEIRVGDIVISPLLYAHRRPRRDEVLETLRMIKPILQKKYNIESLALFGSCSRDEARAKSDIDLAAKFSQPLTLSLLGKALVFLETILGGHKVDLVDVEKITPAILQTAQKDFIYV